MARSCHEPSPKASELSFQAAGLSPCVMDRESLWNGKEWVPAEQVGSRLILAL